MDIEDQKTPLEKMGIIIPEEFEGLFGEPPPLLEGEDPNLYWGLLAAMIKDRKPQSFPEWIYVHDTVNKLWEEQRFKRVSTLLMRGETLSALKYLLKQSDLNPALASKYFSEEAEERQEAVSLLTRYGLTPAVFQAKAAQQNSDAIQMFEAMGARRGRERRKLRQEDERLRRRRDSAKGSNKE